MGFQDSLNDTYHYHTMIWFDWPKAACYKWLEGYRNMVKVAQVEKPQFTDNFVNLLLEEPQAKMVLKAIGTTTSALNILIDGTVRADLFNASDRIHKHGRKVALDDARAGILTVNSFSGKATPDSFIALAAVLERYSFR